MEIHPKFILFVNISGTRMTGTLERAVMKGMSDGYNPIDNRW